MPIYVLGFAFNKTLTTVLLLHKTHPAWQAGRFNGVGGAVEFGEKPLQAMLRKFQKETGVRSQPSDWVRFTSFEDNGNTIHCFTSCSIDIRSCRSMTKEKIFFIGTKAYVFANIIPNLKQLIPQALKQFENVT